MTPEEQIEMRQAFEKLNVVGHKDYSYNVVSRSYNCLFIQAQWKNWQAAWLAGQRYRPGKKMEQTPAPRMARVARTART